MRPRATGAAQLRLAHGCLVRRRAPAFVAPAVDGRRPRRPPALPHRARTHRLPARARGRPGDGHRRVGGRPRLRLVRRATRTPRDRVRVLREHRAVRAARRAARACGSAVVAAGRHRARMPRQRRNRTRPARYPVADVDGVGRRRQHDRRRARIPPGRPSPHPGGDLKLTAAPSAGLTGRRRWVRRAG